MCTETSIPVEQAYFNISLEKKSLQKQQKTLTNLSRTTMSYHIRPMKLIYRDMYKLIVKA